MDTDQMLAGAMRRISRANRRTTSAQLLAYLEVSGGQSAAASVEPPRTAQEKTCCLCGGVVGEMYALHRRRLCAACVEEIKALPDLSPWTGPAGRLGSKGNELKWGACAGRK